MCHDKATQVEKKIHFSLKWTFFPVEDSRIILFVPELYDILCSHDISRGKWWLASIRTEAFLLKYQWKSSITFNIPWLQLGYCSHYLHSLVFAVFSLLYRSSWHFGYSLSEMCGIFKLFLTVGFTVSWNFIWPDIFTYLFPLMFM